MDNNILPKQKISRTKKTEEWGISVIDEFEGLISRSTSNNRTSRENKLINYDLFNGILNKDDFEYVIKPFGFDAEYPANLQHYDIISPKIQLLLGEEIKRPFNYRVVVRNEDAVSKLLEKKKELLFMMLQAELQEEAPQEQGQEEMPKTPKQLEEYMTTNYKDIREIVGQKILTYLIENQRLQLKFNEGFKDGLISSEMIYRVHKVANEPRLSLCNPADVYIIKNSDTEFIDEAYAVIEERWLTIASIIDEYWEELSPKEINSLETDLGRVNSKETDFNYTPDVIKIDNPDSIKASMQNNFREDRSGTIRVLHCEWVSMRKIGILSTDGEPETIVGEEFEIPENAVKDKGKYVWSEEDEMGTIAYELEWYWINEVWEMDKIGSDIYTKPKPCTVQRRSMDNPASVKLNYIGYIYNSRNSLATSLIDRMKAYQYLYDIIYYRLELALAKDKGKVAVMDISQIPMSEGWDVDKWMYYMSSMGVMFINSQEEGKNGQPSQFNQFQSIDLTTGNYINTHIGILQTIEQQIGELCGVSRQRQGQVQTSELVGNTERAVTQSSHITETWFYFHNEVKKRCLEALIDLAQICWKGGKKINYILDDMSRIYLEVEGDEFASTEYGVFVTNSSKDDKIKNSLEQLSHAAIQNQMINLSDIVTILQTESIQDTKRKLENAEEKVRQHQLQVEKTRGEQQQAIQEKDIAFKRELEDRIDARENAANETKIRVAEIGQQNSTEDEKILIQKDKIEKDYNIQERRLTFDREALAKKLELDNKKINAKKP